VPPPTTKGPQESGDGDADTPAEHSYHTRPQYRVAAGASVLETVIMRNQKTGNLRRSTVAVPLERSFVANSSGMTRDTISWLPTRGSLLNLFNIR
jgi:hypothetical protein